MEYTIIVASELTKLKTIVNDFCSYGWEPQGGIIVDPKRSYIVNQQCGN